MINLIVVASTLASLSGAVLGVIGVVGTKRTPEPPRPRRRWLRPAGRGSRWTRLGRLRRAIVLGAAVAGAAVWLFTGVPVAGLIVGLAIVGLPALLLAGTAERRAITRLAAVEQWTRRIADIVANGLGLHAAIVATAATAPRPIEAPVRGLAAAMQAGLPAPAALRRFADEIDDYTCDQVVAPLLLHSQDRGEGLADVLTDISRSMAAEIEMRSTADAKRAGPRFAVRFLTGMTVAVIGFGLLNPSYLAPYATLAGQTLLLTLAVFYVVMMVWARRLSQPERRPRLLRAGGPAGFAGPAGCFPAASDAAEGVPC